MGGWTCSVTRFVMAVCAGECEDGGAVLCLCTQAISVYALEAKEYVRVPRLFPWRFAVVGSCVR